VNFTDIFKKSFLDGYAADITVINVCVCVAITAVIGLYIFFVYRLMTRRCFYDRSFNASLPVLAVITASIIMTIQSNVVISLGMVGALSIVRFRTAIKDPMDLVFLFWAISVGIICGAGLAHIAVIVSLAITVGLLILDRVPAANAPMLLVINADSYDAEDAVLALVHKHSKACRVKSRTLSNGRLDMVIEVRPENDRALAREAMELPHVLSASLLSHDGEVTC